MELIELNAKVRKETGKGAARKLRNENQIPAIVYGAKTENQMLSLVTSSFDKIVREHGTTGLFFNLKVEGESGEDRIVMLKDYQMDTFSINYTHLDFLEVDMDTKVHVMVPVETVGESKGVKEGGILQVIRRELEVICKPADTPESIKIDITELEISDSVHVEDIDLGEAIEIPHEVNFTVVTLVAPTVEEVEEEEEELEEGEVAEDADSSEEAASEE